MVDLRANAELALASGFNLTGRLNHEQVKQVAEAWFPEIRFHEAERFHPVDVDTLFDAPVAQFPNLPEPTRDEFRIEVSGPVGTTRFDPPIIRSGETAIPASRLTSAALNDPVNNQEVSTQLSDGSRYTHGKSLTASSAFFGASTTVAGAPEPAPGNPRVPRHDIVVQAEMRFLLETLKHELQANRPSDALWGRFAVDELFFERNSQQDAGFDRSVKRSVLAALIDAFERGDEAGQLDALADIPQGWQLSTRAWEAATGYAFLEFYFFYAFNDYLEYGDPPFANEHEGDIEGCCVVFERDALEQFADGAIPLEEVIAHSVITSVHEEQNDNDELKRLPVERSQARDDLVVYVAPGSHATYLTPGAHDVLDFEDIVTDFPGAIPHWGLALLTITGLIVVVIIILVIVGIVEHFVDAEDETSDNGGSVGPGPDPAPGGTSFPKRIEVTPLSRIADSNANAYQIALFSTAQIDGFDLAALTRRAFPGKWGAHDGTRDHSSPWENKTARYFRKFLSSGDIRSQVIL